MTSSTCLPTCGPESNNREKGVLAPIIYLRNPYNPLIQRIQVQTIKIGCFSLLENNLFPTQESESFIGEF